MDKNIFIRNKKYNPDVATNYSKALSQRQNTTFSFKDEFINPEIISKDEKVYSSDKKCEDIDSLIKKRLNEREQQEFEFKPTKNIIPSSNPNDFKEYNDLKKEQ